MTKPNYETFCQQLKEDLPCKWSELNITEIIQDVLQHQTELQLLNSLIGSTQIETDFLELVRKHPKVLNLIPKLLAIEEPQISIDDSSVKVSAFQKFNQEIAYLVLLRKTGWFDFLENKQITDLTAYLCGFEMAFKANATENSNQSKMNKNVERYLQAENPIEYFSQMTIKEIANHYHLDMTQLSWEKNHLHEAEKRFDFVVKSQNTLWLIAINFFNEDEEESKLKQTAHYFKALNQSLKKIKGVTFVWITDGTGWWKAQNDLKETYEEIEHLYTLTDLENDILNELFNSKNNSQT